MMIGSQTVVSGPLFSPGRDQIVRAGLEASQRKAASAGAELVRRQLSPGHGVVSGEFRRSITGTVNRSRHGVIYARNAVKGPWLETGRRRGQQTRFRGYGMFRRARRDLEQRVDAVVGPEIRELVRKLDR
jgi:hypothetical protein